ASARPPSLPLCPYTTLFRSAAGFVSTDDHGRVHGLDDVYAAGDVTQFPVKQGGIATQQADSVAAAIAARAGAPVEPAPFRPRRRSEEHTSELQSRGHLVCRL